MEKKNMQLRTTVIENKDLWKNFIYLHNSILFQNDILKMEENILFCFSQLFNLNDPYDDKFQSQHWNDRRINTILEYFHENTDRQISLKELEELVGCSSFHIIRLFKNHTGLTAHAYLTQIRLEKAKQLLNEGKSILDTALSTGFSDQSHLTRNFITRYGLSPGEYLLKKR
ncbi:MAG: AraC family transcriptional regulator [Spirochaetales bacterium]|nr:AraC family transcriptional regulator [Spirochaetales bacterium]